MSPAAAMREMILAGHRARMIQLAAELGLADLLAAGMRTNAELAEATGTDPDALSRLLRALAHLGLFMPTGEDEWRLAPLGETLRTDAPDSCRPAALYWGLASVRAAWDRLDHSVRTGDPAFRHVNGAGFFEHITRRPADGAAFDAFLAQPERCAIHAAAVDWSHFTHVVDVGGGNGAFLRAVLARDPRITGTVFDLPRALAGIRCDDARLGAEAGSFFDRIPPGADAYVLAQILHDWPDGSCLEILRACRTAMPAHATLFVIEQVIGEGTDPAFTAHLDVAMLVLLSGRERKRAEFAHLLGSADFALASVTLLPTSFSLLTCRPINRP